MLRGPDVGRSGGRFWKLLRTHHRSDTAGNPPGAVANVLFVGRDAVGHHRVSARTRCRDRKGRRSSQAVQREYLEPVSREGVRRLVLGTALTEQGESF